MSATHNQAVVNNHGALIWRIADLLRGTYRPHQYGSIIQPFVILRRLDCVLEPTKQAVLEKSKNLGNIPAAISLPKVSKHSFYNTSLYDLEKVIGDPDNIRDNLIDYVNGFSENIRDIFDEFDFDKQLAKLDNEDLLYLITQEFTKVDLHPSTVSNSDMGAVFEELIRKFAEASNETAGEHFTPRDAVALVVDLLFAADDEVLSKPGIVRSIYDPTAGTGGMLAVAEEHVKGFNPDATIVLAGQELNGESYAICKSDMVIKGYAVDAISHGDTLANDQHAGKTFDYCLSNPPYGVEWKKSETVVRKEHQEYGFEGRFGPGLPSISDGQLLFLLHLVSKMRPVTAGGGRVGIVLNGSALFTGAAGSGESEIRRYVIENDLLEAIVALPTDMFYNTGISTYVWILDNDKAPERKGKIQLIDGSGFSSKMKKSLGSKRKQLTPSDIEQIVSLYDEFDAADEATSKVFDNDDFGYRSVTVERPLQLNYSFAPDRVVAALAAKAVQKLDESTLTALTAALETAPNESAWKNSKEFAAALKDLLNDAGVTVAAPTLKAITGALSEHDPSADVHLDKRGKPEANPSLRDTERIPLTEDVDEYIKREVLPHVPDAWIDHSKTKLGYEIPFTRHFYVYEPPRDLAEIDAEIEQRIARIIDLFKEVEA